MATVVLSLTDGCPGLAFYILEIIINVAMILEVVIRFVALGKVRLFGESGGDGSSYYSGTVAILEVTIQCCGLDPHWVLCLDITCAVFSGLCDRQQGGGDL